jgi:hypothetical protein
MAGRQKVDKGIGWCLTEKRRRAAALQKGLGGFAGGDVQALVVEGEGRVVVGGREY